jgi:outer membrane protein assembly factor BamB
MDKNALFYAISADKGKVEWKRKIGTLNASSPAYADGKLFGVSLQPSQVVALDAKRKGKILWRHELPGRSESSPLVRAHRVIFGSESGDIFALDEKTGKQDWVVHTDGEVKGGLAYDDGLVFAGNYGGQLTAIDASTGHIKWQSETQGGGFLRGGGIYTTPSVAYGRVYVGGLDGRIYSFVEKDGSLAWSHSTGAEVYSAPTVADTPHAPPTVYAGSQDKNFYALDARDGSLRWQFPIPSSVYASPTLDSRGTLYSGSTIGHLFALEAATGRPVFDYDVGAPIWTAPALRRDGSLVVGDTRGRVLLFGAG